MQSHPSSREASPPSYKSRDADPYLRPPENRGDQHGRSSFSSIRENDSDLVQTFTLSQVSSYTLDGEAEEAVEEDSTPRLGKMVEAQFRPPVTQPFSKLHGYWTPADSFRGWKGIDVKGRPASKSFGDLQGLHLGWTGQRKPPRRRGTLAPGDAPFERLPIELLNSIISLLVLDIPPGGLSNRNMDLMSLLLTSKTLHMATLDTLYSRVTIPHSRIFKKFLDHISEHDAVGTIVKRLDFSHFNPAQLFDTASERRQAQNLTSKKLLRCLELTPNLQEFLGQEYIDDDLDADVLQKLFFGLPRLQALDFCGCTSASFKAAFSTTLAAQWPAELSIRRLSMHKCINLPASAFETILPRLAHATHLDLAGTRVTDTALASIPRTARITHLNLARCGQLSAERVIDFLATHPAVTSSLTYLSLATDARSHQLLNVEDVTELLQVLPSTLRSLSLKGSKMAKSHIPLLLPLTKHLEELAIGRNLELSDLNALLMRAEDQEGDIDVDWVPHTLKFLDLSDMWGRELDLGYLFGKECALLARVSKSLDVSESLNVNEPLDVSESLDVIELSDETGRLLPKKPTILDGVGWRKSELGSRTWLVRKEKNSPCHTMVSSDSRASSRPIRDDGRRWWKMGAESWGMRKVPVAKADVGGMYGSYMFGRKL